MPFDCVYGLLVQVFSIHCVVSLGDVCGGDAHRVQRAPRHQVLSAVEHLHAQRVELRFQLLLLLLGDAPSLSNAPLLPFFLTLFFSSLSGTIC